MPIFSEQNQKPAQANQALLPILINPAKPTSLINPAQANQAIMQTKEISEKSPLKYQLYIS